MLLFHVGIVSGTSESTNTPFWRLPAGSTALVTGGTKGIGKAVVEELAGNEFGMHVLTCARSQQDLANCLAEWQAAGMKVEGVVADVSTPQGREHLIETLRTWLDGKPLDALINNVGTNIRKPSVEYTAEDLHFLWKTNYERTTILRVFPSLFISDRSNINSV